MEREIRIIHTGDTHIGYRQYHNEQRRQDFLNAFATVIDDAIKMQVDALIHAGDLFDSRNPTLEDILETLNLLSRLKTNDIPFLAIVGNHESKQHTQWMDLFESMGFGIRLGKKPYLIDDIAFYGIDSIPKAKIPLFDPKSIRPPDNRTRLNVLVMHQLMNPFPFGEWDCEELLESLDININLILLGDYHKHEKTKINNTWVTYCGSTERNSASEKEPRSYNIITINESNIDISRRNIPTREFVFIPVVLNYRENVYEYIINRINEHEIVDRVVFIDITGDENIRLSYSEIERYLGEKGALVARIRDMRHGIQNEDNQLPDEISFSDPEEAVKKELKNMQLSTGGLLIDEIVRNPGVPKTKVDIETETRFDKLMLEMDFTKTDHSVSLQKPSFQNEAKALQKKGVELKEVPQNFKESENEETANGLKLKEDNEVEKIVPIEKGAHKAKDQGPSRDLKDTNDRTKDQDLSKTKSQAESVNEKDNGKKDEKNDEKNDEKDDEKQMEDEANSANISNTTRKSDTGNKKAPVKPKQYNLGDYL